MKGLAPDDQVRAIRRCKEIAAALVIPELVSHDRHKSLGQAYPLGVERSLIEINTGVGDIRIVVQVAIYAAPAEAIGVPELPVNKHLPLYELAGSLRGLAITFMSQHLVASGERGDHQAVPGRQHLVVLPGPNPAIARNAQPLP